jgi:hypothetical protein
VRAWLQRNPNVRFHFTPGWSVLAQPDLR